MSLKKHTLNCDAWLDEIRQYTTLEAFTSSLGAMGDMDAYARAIECYKHVNQLPTKGTKGTKGVKRKPTQAHQAVKKAKTNEGAAAPKPKKAKAVVDLEPMDCQTIQDVIEASRTIPEFKVNMKVRMPGINPAMMNQAVDCFRAKPKGSKKAAVDCSKWEDLIMPATTLQEFQASLPLEDQLDPELWDQAAECYTIVKSKKVKIQRKPSEIIADIEVNYIPTIRSILSDLVMTEEEFKELVNKSIDNSAKAKKLLTESQVKARTNAKDFIIKWYKQKRWLASIYENWNPAQIIHKKGESQVNHHQEYRVGAKQDSSCRFLENTYNVVFDRIEYPRPGDIELTDTQKKHLYDDMVQKAHELRTERVALSEKSPLHGIAQNLADADSDSDYDPRPLKNQIVLHDFQKSEDAFNTQLEKCRVRYNNRKASAKYNFKNKGVQAHLLDTVVKQTLEKRLQPKPIKVTKSGKPMKSGMNSFKSGFTSKNTSHLDSQSQDEQHGVSRSSSQSQWGQRGVSRSSSQAQAGQRDQVQQGVSRSSSHSQAGQRNQQGQHSPQNQGVSRSSSQGQAGQRDQVQQGVSRSSSQAQAGQRDQQGQGQNEVRYEKNLGLSKGFYVLSILGFPEIMQRHFFTIIHKYTQYGRYWLKHPTGTIKEYLSENIKKILETLPVEAINELYVYVQRDCRSVLKLVATLLPDQLEHFNKLVKGQDFLTYKRFLDNVILDTKKIEFYKLQLSSARPSWKFTRVGIFDKNNKQVPLHFAFSELKDNLMTYDEKKELADAIMALIANNSSLFPEWESIIKKDMPSYDINAAVDFERLSTPTLRKLQEFVFINKTDESPP